MADPTETARENLTAGAFLFLGGALLLGLSAWHRLDWGLSAYPHSPIELERTVPQGASLKATDPADPNHHIVAKVDGSGRVTVIDDGPSPAFFQTTTYSIVISAGDRTSSTETIAIVSPWAAYAAGAGALALSLGL